MIKYHSNCTGFRLMGVRGVLLRGVKNQTLQNYLE